MTGLTKEQLSKFNDEGMLCIPKFLNSDQVGELLKRSKLILSQCDLSSHPKTTFKTSDNDHIGDKYFFESSDKISYFFDTDAFDENNNLKYSLNISINKIGHGLHIKDEIFKKYTLNEDIKDIVKDLNFKQPKVLQSMCIFKQPKKNKEDKEVRQNAVPPHTDGTFLFTEPQSAIGFWIALEDCTIENGCLSYIPQSHKLDTVTKRFVRVDGCEKGCTFQKLKDEEVEYNDSQFKTVECKAGSLILIHNSVLHKSEDNVSNKSRYAYAFHVIDGETKYDELNWLQVPYTGGSNFTRLY
ncbi:unnamed protein product [Candida verbasci]|uniref:Phytanoyl-CoA dioxygenase n=1 Tax=Candida verbasci TaxID=1227364 RepID=A0A9W4TTE2_9ASCO|nr:unnamed protein product [Candida verbasci]